jgi:hypothetical protein
METFKDLYEYLQVYDGDDITKWLEDRWVGKDKQESLLRLFSGLGIIDKLQPYDICKGNFNKKTINKHDSIRDVFYNEKNNLINLKDKGDASDLTGINKKNNKHLLVTTSKNLNKTNVGKLDIDPILTNFKQYSDDGFEMTLCVCIKSSSVFKIMMNGIEQTNNKLKALLEKEDTIIIDWNDLNQAYHNFKMYFGNKSVDEIINTNKSTLCLKMHQRLGVLKTLRLKNTDKKRILWGHIQRSGKSYIIGGCIIEDSKNKEECNYLIITTAPNETLEQQRKVFECIQLNDFNIIVLNGKNTKPAITNKNIILCSKQFLQTKIGKLSNTKSSIESKPKSIAWLKKISFDMRFIDESHNGGTTNLAKETLEFYGKSSFTVQITATYSKPINDYNISKDCWILWDLEDIKLCKNISDEGNNIRLVEKHGECIKDIISKYSQDSIISEYSKYPELWLLTDEIKEDAVSEILKDTQDNNYGWSPDACFLLKQAFKKDKDTNKNKLILKDEFQNEGENLKLWHRIFGKKTNFGIPDKHYPDNIVFIKRIEKICKDPTIDSRFIGEGDFRNDPMIIMAFLPQNNIDTISKATMKLLEKHQVIPEYVIISINSNTTSNPKQTIEEARVKAKNSGKKGVLVLSGKQCSLGVTIDNCDIVLLLNNSMGFDMIYQMMFRCMTEGRNKKCGFVVDLNIHRVIETSVINYASLIKPDVHPREATKFILQERLINLNGDHWMPSFGNDVSKITALCKNVYEIYSSNTENALNHFLNRLRFKEILLTKEEQKIFNAMFSNTTPTKIPKELIDKLLEEDDEKEKIKKGIEKKVDNEDIDTSSETSNNNADDEKEDKQTNYMDILKHIIPLICLLTIHDKETSFIEMFELIENDEYVYNILIDQTKSWWGKSIDSKIIKKFINIYIKYMKDDKETNQIIRTVKELFMKNIKNNRELSNLIDKYLIPQELEKKSNAEVSTPFKLRQEMLDKIPVEFWTSIKRVFEPCAGKGGFIVDIIDRFMTGLKDTILDEKERYKTIVEKCVYFSDINPTNIFICKLLIDPYNEHKLNYNEGNTLELDIKEKWGIDGFDAIIGNPPYQAVSENGVSKGGGNNLYTKFIYYADKNLNRNGYLLYINPPTYFGPGRSNNKNDMNLRKDVLDKYYYHYINLEECAKHFNVGSKFIYYLIQKNSNKNDNIEIVCKYNNKVYKTNLNQDLLKRDYLPYLLTNECLKILDKVKNNYNDKLQIFHSPDNRSDKKHVLNKLKKEKNEDYKKRSLENGYIYPMQATSVQVVYSSKKCKNQNNKKVLMSRSGYLKPFYDNSILGVGGDCFACLVEDEIEGNKIIELLNSKLYKFYIETNKWSGFHNKEVLQDLPNIINKIDDVNDGNIYKYFELTNEEIKFIESSI